MCKRLTPILLIASLNLWACADELTGNKKVSHDTINHLSAANGFLELLATELELREWENHDVKHYLIRIKEGLDNAAHEQGKLLTE